MQYHSLNQSGSLQDLITRHIQGYSECVITQLMEAIRYLHDDVKVLHNDLKANNVLVCHRDDDAINRKVCADNDH